MPVRGIRGATVASANQSEAILLATRELLDAILVANPELRPEDVASVLFTVTEDLTATYPAKAARQFGWTEIPLMCAREIPVAESPPFCIRVLLHWNTHLPQSVISHVYLGAASQLRPDLKVGRIIK